MGNGILSRANSGDGAKIGTIRLSARDSLGEKWALCNGDPVTGGGDDTLEVRYHWKPLDEKINNFYAYKQDLNTDKDVRSSIVYDHINNKYYHIEIIYSESENSITIKEISNELEITTIITKSYTSSNKYYDVSKFECCIGYDNNIFLLSPNRSRTPSYIYYHIKYTEDGNTSISTASESVISYNSSGTSTNIEFTFTSPSSQYISHLVPSASGKYIYYMDSIKVASDGRFRISYYHWLLGDYAHKQKTTGYITSPYGTPIDGGMFGYAISKNCTITLPTFIFDSGYTTYCHIVYPTSSGSGSYDFENNLPYSNPSSSIKCKTLVTPSCIDYENDIFYCVGYDGGIYKIQIVDKVVSLELINSTWIDYAQNINFEFTAIKFHTQYKADGTKQLYMFIVGEEGSYVAPINDITTFGPDAVFTEIPNLQAKDILTGNVLTDAAFVNRLLIINDKNNNDIMFYEQSLPEIDKPGVNAFIKIKN